MKIISNMISQISKTITKIRKGNTYLSNTKKKNKAYLKPFEEISVLKKDCSVSSQNNEISKFPDYSKLLLDFNLNQLVYLINLESSEVYKKIRYKHR